MKTPNDDYDNPWKMAADRYFREFLAIFCPGLEAAIDWSVEPTSHDQELRQVCRDAKTGLRRLDKLVKVQLLGAGELCIHIEVQLCRQRGFERRMFTYSSRLFDRYGCAVASLAVLADRCPGWRPGSFWCEAWGTRLGLEFTAIKLLDYLPAPAGQEDNFFALFAQAHFATIRTRRDPDARLAGKLALTRLAYASGWPKRRILDFVDVLDWLMQIPEPQKICFEAALSELERRLDMPYVNSMVRDAIAKGEALGLERGMQRGIRAGRELGMQQGMQQGMQKGMQQGMQRGIEQGIEVGQLNGRRQALAELLAIRFGALSEAAKSRIDQASGEQLSRWMAKTVVAGSQEEVLGDE